MVELGKTVHELRRLAQGRPERRKSDFAHASQGVESEGRTLMLCADPQALKGLIMAIKPRQNASRSQHSATDNNGSKE